jgi:hypothetical protein
LSNAIIKSIKKKPEKANLFKKLKQHAVKKPLTTVFGIPCETWDKVLSLYQQHDKEKEKQNKTKRSKAPSQKIKLHTPSKKIKTLTPRGPQPLAPPPDAAPCRKLSLHKRPDPAPDKPKNPPAPKKQ